MADPAHRLSHANPLAPSGERATGSSFGIAHPRTASFVPERETPAGSDHPAPAPTSPSSRARPRRSAPSRDARHRVAAVADPDAASRDRPGGSVVARVPPTQDGGANRHRETPGRRSRQGGRARASRSRTRRRPEEPSRRVLRAPPRRHRRGRGRRERVGRRQTPSTDARQASIDIVASSSSSSSSSSPAPQAPS